MVQKDLALEIADEKSKSARTRARIIKFAASLWCTRNMQKEDGGTNVQLGFNLVSFPGLNPAETPTDQNSIEHNFELSQDLSRVIDQRWIS